MKRFFLTLLLFINFQHLSWAIEFNKIKKNEKIYGYRDENGNYKWFDEKKDSAFVDEMNCKWTKVSINKEKWDRAITIRNANICALLKLGFDTMKVLKDVQLLNENSILFTHFSKLENFQDYIFSWKTAFNSYNFKYSARKSSKIPKTNLSLKFYLQKANTTNAAALGLVKRNTFRHLFEFGSEILKKLEIKINRLSKENYLNNYMHLNNAIEMLTISSSDNTKSVNKF
ncbi:MAG: hypothetical protein HUU47_10075 [Bacteroidetes bacterium]|nr:hypothetical protein [Bacteroidota bacterium]